ncbi:MAG: phosphate signaling complex protein PhoU [Rhodospirillales bacterium]
MNSNDHIVKSYDRQLNELDKIIAEMGGLAEAQFADSIEALMKRDEDKAARIIAADKRLDQLEHAVDAQAIKMIALRQPMADDLRMVVTALRTASILERVGDYAKNVAKRAVALSATSPVGPAKTVMRMGHIVQGMLKDVLDSYLEHDVAKALAVRERDEEVDALHTSLFRELITYMMEDPRNITPCTHLLFVAKNVERVGDQATNIAEHVHFMVTGKLLTEDRSKSDEASFLVVEGEGA